MPLTFNPAVWYFAESTVTLALVVALATFPALATCVGAKDQAPDRGRGLAEIPILRSS